MTPCCPSPPRATPAARADPAARAQGRLADAVIPSSIGWT
jgi:hypothetical protein